MLGSDELSNNGIAFVNVVVDTLWYIDGQYDKIQSRCDHGSVPSIPDVWLRFRKESGNKGSYNDRLLKKQKPPQMEHKKQEKADNLISLLSHHVHNYYHHSFIYALLIHAHGILYPFSMIIIPLKNFCERKNFLPTYPSFRMSCNPERIFKIPMA